jgi:hypothetical protein
MESTLIVMGSSVDSTSAKQTLVDLYNNKIKPTHLKTLLSDEARNSKMLTSWSDIILDYTHTKIDEETLE